MITVSDTYFCSLCRRHLKHPTTEHHLIPRTCHSNRWFKKNFSREQMRETISLCSDCHNAVHQFIPNEKLLGRRYYSLELLLTHAQIAKYVVWIGKQK
jgi:hypothetical protein